MCIYHAHTLAVSLPLQTRVGGGHFRCKRTLYEADDPAERSTNSTHEPVAPRICFSANVCMEWQQGEGEGGKREAQRGGEGN
jgi:hypothetical protein